MPDTLRRHSGMTEHQPEADRLRGHLLTQVRDDHMSRFESSASNHQIFLDNQTKNLGVG